MSLIARFYIYAVLVAGTVVSVLALFPLAATPSQQVTFLLLVSGAVVTQLLEVEAPNHQSYYPALVFFFAGLFVLPLGLAVGVIVVPHLVEWLLKRWQNSPFLRAWYIQPFNIASHLLASVGALALHQFLNLGTPTALDQALSVVGAALTYAFVNHLLIGMALVLGRGISWHESGVLAAENLLIDVVLLLIGYTTALLWMLNPGYLPLALAPLILIYRAMLVPQLKRDAEVDGKTGLLNARTWLTRLEEQLGRSAHHDQSFALLMADLDYLRTINNSYGHLAGDAVLSEIGRLLRQQLPAGAVAGRFGGEEFSVLLPGMSLLEAHGVAEQVRLAIANHEFEIDTRAEPIRATMSIGVAHFPSDGVTASDLIHQTDIAVYHAKARGRNRVVCRADVPHSFSLEEMESAHVDADAPIPPELRSWVAATSSTPVEVTTPAASEPASPRPPAVPVTATERPRPAPSWRVTAWIATLLLLATGVTAWGSVFNPPEDWLIALLFVVLAMLAERLQWTLYENSSASVSMAFIFATALAGNMAAVALASLGVALINAWLNDSRLYKIGFNWSLHTLAAVPVLLLAHQPVVHFTIARVGFLVIPSLLAAGLYYLIETSLLAFTISLAEGRPAGSIWRSQFRWLAKHYLALGLLGLTVMSAAATQGMVGVFVFVIPLALMRHTMKEYVARTERGARELQRMNRELHQANQEIRHAGEAIHQLNEELFLALAMTVDARDPFVSGHGAQVAAYAEAIAQELDWPDTELTQLRQAAYLHDIGKIAIPDNILHKPGRLTDREYEVMKTHADRGGEFLDSLPGLAHLAPLVRHHHERWDGQGYPDRLADEEIPLGARILGLCDAVEAMASDRPYSPAKAPADILAEIRRCSGGQFDPTVVEAFLRIVERDGEQFIINSAEKVIDKQKKHESLAVVDWVSVLSRTNPVSTAVGSLVVHAHDSAA